MNTIPLLRKKCSYCKRLIELDSSGKKYCSIICRIYNKVRITKEGCHLYEGTKTKQGCSIVTKDSRSVLVHRYIHEQEIGPIPKNHDVKHYCGIKNCVNSRHLYIKDRNALTEDAKIKKCLNRLHLMTKENTIIVFFKGTDKIKQRLCKKCFEKNKMSKSREDIEKAKSDRMKDILSKSWKKM